MPASAALPGRPRAGGRLARSPELAAALAARLTARDRWLLRMLHEHRVLTTTQIADLAFGTTRAATARMSLLYQYRAVDRFRPLAPAGSAPLHFILDDAGAAVLAAEDGTTTAELGYRRDRAVAIALSPRLGPHHRSQRVLHRPGRRRPHQQRPAALECWWSERRCAAMWGDLARPDGYGRWTEQPPGQPPVTADFFLEYDTGSEDLPRLIAKLAGYADLAARTGIATPVLFWLPTPRREAALRARLAGPPPHSTRDAASAAQIPGVPVATATPRTSRSGPAGPAWLPAGTAGPRLRLAQLAPPGTPSPAPGPQPGGQPAAPLPGGLAWYPPTLPRPPGTPCLARPASAEASDD